MGGAGFGGGVLFEEVADFEVEMWEVGGAAEPVVVGVDVGEGDDLAAFKGCEAVVELGFTSGGWVVLHDLSCAALAGGVDLEEEV